MCWLALLIGVCLIGGLVRRNGVVEVCCVGGGVRRALHFFDLLVLSDWGVCDGCVCFGLYWGLGVIGMVF